MYDYHIHSNFSYDHRGGSSIEEITLAAIALGLKEIALTDHFDPNFPADQADLDFPEYKRELLRVKELYKTKIRLVPGIELGLRVGDTISSCAREIASWQYEFVIASVHSAGEHPIHMPAYREERSTIDAVLFYYETVLDCIKSFDNFDVLGHVNVIERYLPELPDEDLSIGAVELIFKEVIAKGKGIEINTSDVRYGQKTTIPTLGMLKRYRALGGEIVTIGSDSHGVRYIGEGISRGQELLREAGFTYQATYENRKPIFHKIGG